MMPLVLVLLALAGGVGAACRLVLDGVIRSRTSGALPWGTILINVTGSFLLGVLTGLAGHHLLPSDLQAVLGTGFLGGYTTFSTAIAEVSQAGLAYLAATLIGAVVAVAAGSIVAR